MIEQINNKSISIINVIFLILEYPVAFLLSIFTLDGHACKLSFQSNPWEQFGTRFLFAFVPLLVINVIISIIIKLLFKYYAKKIYQSFVLKRFILYHNTYLIIMILVILITHLIIDGYV